MPDSRRAVRHLRHTGRSRTWDCPPAPCKGIANGATLFALLPVPRAVSYRLAPAEQPCANELYGFVQWIRIRLRCLIPGWIDLPNRSSRRSAGYPAQSDEELAIPGSLCSPDWGTQQRGHRRIASGAVPRIVLRSKQNQTLPRIVPSPVLAHRLLL